jgi:hypothetical protein
MKFDSWGFALEADDELVIHAAMEKFKKDSIQPSGLTMDPFCMVYHTL